MGTTELQRFIDNKSLVALKKFAKAETELKELKAKHDEVIAQVQKAMEDNGVQKIDGDWGSITLAERNTYKAVEMDEVPAEFVKPALDTAKVKAHNVLTGDLPTGVAVTTTKYLVKRFKEL